jgi:hypothetical protein
MRVLSALVVLLGCTGQMTGGAAPDAHVPAPDRDAGSTPLPGEDAGAPRSDAGMRVPVPVPELPEGPLMDLPSERGPHVASIEALGDGEWLALGAPAADPTYGVGLGRSWGGRAFVLAPELRGAFFAGEGVHAYVKPDGYAMDDVFFYDIHAHRWIAVYPGMHVASFNDRARSGDLRVDERGQVRDAAGHYVPIHTLIHAWDFMTYDTRRHRFAWIAGDGMGRYYLPGVEQMEEGLVILEAQRGAASGGAMSPWYYDTTTAAFHRDPIESWPADVGGYSAFVYVAERDRFYNCGSQGVQYFDPSTSRWTRVEDSGPRPPGYDHGVAYDWRRGRIYMGSADTSVASGIFVYDLATDTWTNPSTTGDGPATFRTNSASIMYDDANDVVTVFHYERGRVYTYEPDAQRWSSAEMPADVLASRSFNGFYDPELNAYFIHRAYDSGDDGVMWAYRYRAP